MKSIKNSEDHYCSYYIDNNESSSIEVLKKNIILTNIILHNTRILQTFAITPITF